ncbi:MAG: hypothetical protein JRI23_25890 [Deltaproteobacteria bacterium]|jgi:hypothetical protein|nr:hypothetical protein [Deltaproteobacteria bacterium]MBW2535460.1 hypothetical protein [Deltaproteobacteria bacterium]
MAYRDPVAAAEQRVAAAREEVAERLERVRPELLGRLPKRLRARLERAAHQAGLDPEGLEELEQLERGLARYRELLDEALSLAPEIDASYNRLPRDFPDRRPVSSYVYVDVYHERYQTLRSGVHDRIAELDPTATVFDRVPRYFDFEERPFLVEATFRYERHPMRLQATATGLAASNQQGVGLYNYVLFQLVTRVRLSAPSMRLCPEGWTGGLLAALRLRRDVQVGQEAFDDAFLVDVAPVDAERVFSSALCDALLRVAEIDVPSLDVRSGVAVLEWREKNEPARGLAAALEALVALRTLEPISLVRG